MIEEVKKFYRELRCKNCRRLLAQEYLLDGRIEIKCGACNSINSFDFKHLKQLKKKNTVIVLEKNPGLPQNTTSREKGKK